MTTKRRSDLSGLRSPFKEGIIWLEEILKSEKIFMIRWETVRTDERQDMLFRRGNSKARAGQSPHNMGFAVDYVLDTSKVEVARKIWKNRWVEFAWDTESPKARETWLRFGDTVRRIGFDWGGDFGATPKAKGIGWDFPHVQMKDYRKRVGQYG